VGRKRGVKKRKRAEGLSAKVSARKPWIYQLAGVRRTYERSTEEVAICADAGAHGHRDKLIICCWLAVYYWLGAETSESRDQSGGSGEEEMVVVVVVTGQLARQLSAGIRTVRRMGWLPTQRCEVRLEFVRGSTPAASWDFDGRDVGVRRIR
jgi:hypothetical protein